MTSLFVLILIVVLSLVVVRIGTNALILTGMTEATAKFQSASAFFGVGFTTSEAELVMNHPIRRRMVLHLIIAGNIGITSALATLIVTFVQIDSSEHSNWFQFVIVVTGVVGIAFIANFKPIKKPADVLMVKLLKSTGVVKSTGYELLLKVEEGFSVSEVKINSDHQWCGKQLYESRPSDYGVVVLNVRHADGGFTGAPDKDFKMREGDEIMIYGSDICVSDVANNLPEGRRSIGASV